MSGTFLFALLFMALAGCAPTPSDSDTQSGPDTRIVSMAPSITETVYLLGGQDKLVGVTTYCNYPAEATQHSKVGGYYDPSYEAIAALQPDRVILFEEHDSVKERLTRLGIPYTEVGHRSIDAILESISIIGRVFDLEQEAAQVINELEVKLHTLTTRFVEDHCTPKVLICVGREEETGMLNKIYATGNDNYFNDLLEHAHAENVYEGSIPYPVLSAEGILHLQPDVILDIIPDMKGRGLTKEQTLKDWSALNDLNAVRSNRVHILFKDYAARPGPRFILLLEDIINLTHPEMDCYK